MKPCLGTACALSLAFGFCITQVPARGGHGGGHGGHHGGHHSGHHGHHASHHHTGHHRHHASHHAHHHAHWAHHNRPFSRDWYGRHHHAWGGGWGWGNPWNVANWGTTAAWLGLGAAAVPEWGGYGPTDTTVYDTDNESLNVTVPETEAAQNLSTEALNEQTAAAQALAAQGATEPAGDEKFLPLGVFTLAPEDQTEASALVQLAVSKDGLLRGTYYDLLTDADQPIQGAIDKRTQRAAFTLGSQGKIAFQTALGVLTEPSGPISVHYENGQTRQWVLARYQQEPSENGAQDESGDPSVADDTTSDADGN